MTILQTLHAWFMGCEQVLDLKTMHYGENDMSFITRQYYRMEFGRDCYADIQAANNGIVFGFYF